MRRVPLANLLGLGAAVWLAAAPVSSQTERPHPLTKPLDCPLADCPLLQGVPQTAGMRGGLVHLQPGATAGWHTTGMNEEALVILQGQGRR